MHPLETYLAEVATLRGATKETSGYPALANLLNAIGHTLKPRVKCVIHPRNQGAGIPDGGLFTPDQLKQYDEAEDFGDLVPARGVIEVKSVGDDIADFAESEQVEKYLARYGQALLTNYREFLLLKRIGGKTHRLEGFQLAPDEKSFWLAAAHPRKAADALGERFIEYLKRVMLHAAPLNNPKDVAFFLASYARDARARVEGAGNLPALAAVRGALEEALGMKFEAEKGEHFFRSTLVQTLFYGVFSAWVLWHKQQVGRAVPCAPPACQDALGGQRTDRPTELFDWRSAAWTLHVPMIKALFEQVATPTKLGPLGLVEVLDWTAAALNRVDRAAFFERFVEDHAVQYFYEPFLEAFDPELRKQLGVWYTPPEIVQYQVARVDAALREELDIPDGLADPRVFVLDPCCGTGAYLVEVLRHIHKFLKDDQGMGALAEHYTKQAAQERVFGFELLPAPFVVAHLQMGLLLQNLSVPLDDSKNERAAIYLTNALTGWEPPSEEAKKQLTFAIPEFKQEKEAADGIKQEKKIIVILGNPPYNGYAGLAVEEERDLSNAYRTTKRAAAPQGQGLNDLYIRFFRMAERRIVEKSGEGIISFISNYSWLDGLSFTGMRERYLEVFDSITVDCLNGDKFKTGKLTPEGKPDPSVFSTESNREGIQVGTAIATLIRRSRREEAQTLAPHPNPLPAGEGTATFARRKSKRVGSDPALGAVPPLPTGEGRGEGNMIHFRHLWGKDKRGELLATLNAPSKKIYTRLKPPLEVGLPFLPMKTESGYYKWPLLTGLFPVSFPGVKTSRDEFLVDVEKDVLVERLEKYFDPEISHEEMRRIAPSVMEKSPQFKAERVRDELCKRGILKKNIIRFCYRPFDVRWLYWEPETNLLDRGRPDFLLQVFEGNVWIEARQKQTMDNFDRGYFTKVLSDNFGNGLSNFFPLWLKPNPDPSSLFDAVSDGKPKANLTDAAKEFLADLRLGNQPEELFYHTLAVLHAPEYRVENSGALRQDWPRVPLPKSRKALLASAELGRQVAALLDTETPVDGVTKGKPRPELKAIGELSCPGKSDLKVTAGWGHAGQNGVTMPGKGRLETRAFTAEEAADGRARRSARAADCNDDFQTDGERRARSDAPYLGHSTHDIFLNEAACWRNVPEKVWDYTIGGYQVMKKWLSYREFELLGRALTPDEAREVTHTARRIAALILLQPELDKNYQTVKAATVAL
ncbi:MAG: N-6 DNA methylase [Verrucomicrobiales bacterium]|nr:N-6 DNA methylase [Verrucomicrobiales bacterium]